MLMINPVADFDGIDDFIKSLVTINSFKIHKKMFDLYSIEIVKHLIPETNLDEAAQKIGEILLQLFQTADLKSKPSQVRCLHQISSRLLVLGYPKKSFIEWVYSFLGDIVISSVVIFY